MFSSLADSTESVLCAGQSVLAAGRELPKGLSLLVARAPSSGPAPDPQQTFDKHGLGQAGP